MKKIPISEISDDITVVKLNKVFCITVVIFVFSLIGHVSAGSNPLVSGLPTGPISRFPLERGPLVLQCATVARSTNYVEALGEQGGIWGASDGSFEAWVYPFKLLYGLTLEFSTRLENKGGGRAFQSSSQLIRRQVATPHMAQLHLADKQFALTETLFVPRRLPGISILLDIDTSVDLQVAVRFKVSLAPMLLDIKEKPKVSWDSNKRQLVAFEEQRKVRLYVWSPLAVSHVSQQDGSEKITLNIPAKASKKGLVPICLAVSWPEGPSAHDTLLTMSTKMDKLFRESMAHYQKVLAGAPIVESPEPQVNEALLWSVVSLDQLRVRNPFLGYGLVSGYAPSGEGTRPGYAWFFDEPTLTSWAYLRAGLTGHVREALSFLLRYQRADGKMVHEIIQSLPYYPDYFKKYRYAYIHSSSGLYFLAACGHYYRSTGDLAFIKEHWPKIRKMLHWCIKAVDPNDGLMQIAAEDWGSSESSFAVSKDTQMEGMWVFALREIAYLAEAMGDGELAERCAKMAERASASIEQRLWDSEASTYYWGLNRAGQPLRSLVPHHSVSIWMQSLRPDRIPKVLERMACSDFRTDWGVRSLSASDKRYDPKGYQTGSVWPVWNAGVIIGDYRYGRQIDAFRNLMSMFRVRNLEALGPMPEVLDGQYCRRLKNGVPHQMFSETAVQNGFYDGLLGLDIDLPSSQVRLSPRLPASWERLGVRRIPLGSGHLDIIINRRKDIYELTFNVRSADKLTMLLRPLLPAGCKIEKVLLDEKPVKAKTLVGNSGTTVVINVPDCRGRHTLQIYYEGGFDFIPEDTPIRLGEQSRNLRLIRTEFADSTWHLVVEGLPKTVYPLIFNTGRLPSRIVGGRVLNPVRSKSDGGSAGTAVGTSKGVNRQSNGVRIGLSSPPEATKTYNGYVRWKAEISWK